MLKNYFKIAVRNLLRQKVFSAINIFGLALGIACCILIALFVEHEWSFDKFHRHKDRLYRAIEVERKVGGEENVMAFQPLPLAPALETEFPEVEHAARVFTGGGTVSYGEKSFAEDFVFTDPAFFEMFDFPLLRGNPATALADPKSVVITRRIAEKYFGDENPLGKQLSTKNWRTSVDVVVSGVAENPPSNSSIQFDFLLHITQYPNYERNLNRWGFFNGSVYVLLKSGTDGETLQSKTPAFVDKYWGEMRKGDQQEGRLAAGNDAVQLRFQPMTKIHLDTSINFSQETVSNPLYAYFLAGIALLVLTIACINFVTLAIGRSTTRAREVGVRKVLGAHRAQLIRQFWGETMLLSGLAFVFGLVLAELLLPVFNQFTQKDLALGAASRHVIAAAIAGLLPLVGLLAGSYPAAFLSRFQPVTVLKGTIRLRRKSVLTRALVVFQFGLSIFLIVCTLFMARQQHFISTRDLGYNSDNVIAINTFGGAGNEGEQRVSRLRQVLAGNPQILGVTGTNASFNQGWDINSFKHEGVERSAFVYRVDDDYLDVLGIKLIAGRNFSREFPSDVTNAVIVNEALVDEFEWQEPIIGRRLAGWNEQNIPGGPTVVGVVKNYHFLSMHQKIKPVLLLLDPDWSISHALVHINSRNIPATLDLIGKKWQEVAPNTPFEYSFVNDDVRKQYEKEMRWQKIFTYSAAFAVLLACLGLFGLATLAASTRTKEVGIRKVLGATVTRIAVLLSRDFVVLVLFANFLAWPAAYYAVNKWLQNFAYRIDISWWVFALAGGLALLIALVTVSTQAIKAAVANPVEALRYE